MITNKITNKNNYTNIKSRSAMKFTKFIIGICALAVVANAHATLEDPQLSDIPLLQASLYLKDIEMNIHRYKAAMILMSNTKNRDDFLINRDELWGSREQLSYAAVNLEESSHLPYAAENKKLADEVRELLNNCEAYANEKNEIIAVEAKLETAKKEIARAFQDIKDSEMILSKRQLSPDDDELFIKISNVRSIFEVMLSNYIDADNSQLAYSQVDQVKKSLAQYEDLMNTSLTKFPELEDSYLKTKSLFDNLFSKKGVGSEYYIYLQKLENQKKTEAYFNKLTKDLLKSIMITNSKIKARLGI